MNAYTILTEIEKVRLRYEREGKKEPSDYIFRLCQAIVADIVADIGGVETNRSEWYTKIKDKIGEIK